jgi:hypothetical protein
VTHQAKAPEKREEVGLLPRYKHVYSLFKASFDRLQIWSSLCWLFRVIFGLQGAAVSPGKGFHDNDFTPLAETLKSTGKKKKRQA